MQITNNMRKIRRECDKTQQECADALGVTRKGYAWYEKSSRVYFDVVARLSGFLGIEISHIMIIGK